MVTLGGEHEGVTGRGCARSRWGASRGSELLEASPCKAGSGVFTGEVVGLREALGPRRQDPGSRSLCPAGGWHQAGLS